MAQSIRRSTGTAAVALAVLATGCGSTVGGTVGVGQPRGGGEFSVGGAAPTAGVVSGSAVGASTATAQLGSSATAAAGGSVLAVRGAATDGAVPGQHGASGPGVTPTTVSLGVAYFQNANAANEAIGGKGIEVSDPTTTARAIVTAVNRSGGIAGRHVLPLFFAVDPQSSTPYATEAQAECAYFTEDHKVFAVIDGTQAVGSLARPCLEQHHVVVVTDNSVVVSDLYPHEVDPDSILWGRLFASLVPSLSRQGWFAPWNKATGRPGATRARTGIVTADRPALNRAVDGVLVPLLRQAGYPPNPADVIRVAPPGGFGDDGATVAAIDNAVLKLDADRVDHVILTDSNGSISLLFNNYAYSQHYLPRYAGSTGNFWQSLLAAGDIQPQTLAGALGIGWMPVLDLPFRGADSPYPNSTRHRCLTIMRAAGQQPTSATIAGSQLVACDAFFLLQFALRPDRGPLDSTVLMERVDALGTSFQPGLALGDRFATDQRDGVGAGYDMAFDGGCGCFAYQGPVRTFAGVQP